MKKAISAIRGAKSKVIGKKKAPKVKKLLSDRRCLLHRHGPTGKVVDANRARPRRHALSTDEQIHRQSLLDDAWVRAREITYMRGVAVICIRCLFCDTYHVLTGDEWESGARRGEFRTLEDVYTAMYGAQAEPRFEPRIKDVIKLPVFLFPYISSQYRAGAIFCHSLEVLSRIGGAPEVTSVAELRFTPSDQPYLHTSPSRTLGSPSDWSKEVYRPVVDDPKERNSIHRPVLRLVTDIPLDSSDEIESMSLRTLDPATFGDGLRGISPRSAISQAQITEFNRSPCYYYGAYGEDLLDVSCRERWTLERRRKMSRYEGYPGFSAIRIALLMARSFERAFPWRARVLSTVTKAAEFLPVEHHPILADPFWLILHPGGLNSRNHMLRPNDRGSTPVSANFTRRDAGIALPATLPELFTHQGWYWRERGDLPYQRQIQSYLEWLRTSPRAPSIYFDAVEEQNHLPPRFPDPSRVYDRTALSQEVADPDPPGPSRSDITENAQNTQSPTRYFDDDDDVPDRFDFSRWVHDPSSPEPAPSDTSDDGERTQESEHRATPQVQASAGNSFTPCTSSPDPNVDFPRFLQSTTEQLTSRYSLGGTSDLAFMRDHAWE